MKTETIFREIDSLISVTEAMQHELSGYTFDTLKIIEHELPYFCLNRIQNWVLVKSDSLFQFARNINIKAERFSENYIELIKPAPRGSYMPVGIDIDDI
ncbi:hypothetical protein [Marinobacter halophilus]|uniref:Uncharacterized protein n=1 Tax=Marinobacter halophilus TaxID=1323740 RepID=A0A2T1K850_9GAMM|nr:hypothetical protein [Marinobacter halophilus]PSF06285.1 hypothetical protein C7H08_14275 [Marinobacter halophilus]GGC71308.1 hypothetical protein GCM10011362_19730 [Marinobacter halophilus]